MIFQLDSVNINDKIYGRKPRISISSRDDHKLFMYTARSVKLTLLDTVTLTSSSRLKVFYGTSDLIWTGDIDWYSRQYDDKTNLVNVTFLPDVATLKNLDIDNTFSSAQDFTHVLDYIVNQLTGWSWQSGVPLNQIYVIEEYQVPIKGTEPEPHPNEGLSTIGSDCFYEDLIGPAYNETYIEFDDGIQE